MTTTITIKRVYNDHDNWFYAEKYVSYDDEWQTLYDEPITGKVYEILDDNLDYLKETDPHNYFYYRINSNDHLIIAVSGTCDCMKQRHYHYKEGDIDIIFKVVNNKKN